MLKMITGVLALLLLGGCSKHYHPLDASKKAKLVSELVNNAPGCGIFKVRLTSPAMDDDAIDTVYHDAQKAKCINKDV